MNTFVINMSSNQRSGESVESGIVVSSNSKPAGKCFRICTVCAYLFAVSFGAIILSLYYIFLWCEDGSNELTGKGNCTRR